MKKIAALSALAIMATAGSAFAAPSLETRILVQTITGSGATRVINNTASTMFAQGDRIRLTVQYRFNDPDGLAPGGALLGSFLFNLQTQINSGSAGTISRSALTDRANATGTGNSFNSEAGASIDQSLGTWANGPVYPQSRSNALTGLHNSGGNLRGLLSGGLDTASANGTIVGDDINTILAGASAAALATTDFNEDPIAPGTWLGLYSAEFQSSNAGPSNMTFSIFRDPAATIRWYTNSGGNTAMPGDGYVNAQPVTLQFGTVVSNTAPTIAEVSPINGAPNFTPVPDINNVLIATVTDAEGILAGQVMAMLNTGTPDNLGSLVFSTNQVDANTVQVFMSYEIVNSDLAGGPKSFTVKINANDGDLAADQKIVTVNLVPAPGAAALLGLGGLIAARRRRA